MYKRSTLPIIDGQYTRRKVVRLVGVRAQPQMLINVSIDPEDGVVSFTSEEASLGAADACVMHVIVCIHVRF